MRRVFLSLVMRIKGNVNADESISNRITIKKILSSDGSIRPFVSARAIRRAIRERLLEKGFEIDPFTIERSGGTARLQDIGDPIKYVDDDLFGYLAIKRKKGGEAGEGIPRKSAVKVSYLISMKHAEITVERGGRFPRPNTLESVAPTPFEIEVADFIGLLNMLVEDRIGVFLRAELKDDVLKNHKNKLLNKGDTVYLLDNEERRRRAKALFEIVLKEGWMFPRAATSYNSSETYYAVIATSESFITLGGYVEITDDNRLDIEGVERFAKIYKDVLDGLYVIEYREGKILEFDKNSGSFAEKELDADAINSLIENLAIYLIP